MRRVRACSRFLASIHLGELGCDAAFLACVSTYAAASYLATWLAVIAPAPIHRSMSAVIAAAAAAAAAATEQLRAVRERNYL